MSSPTAAPQAVAKLRISDLDHLFEGTIKRPWASPFYILGLLVVAAAMILLPAIYLGLIGLVGYGVYYHAVNDIGILAVGHGGARGRFVLYVAPLAIGVTIILFMLKPLFARPARVECRLSLVRDREPVLFEFVDRLCRLVGARCPSRIDVNCEFDAGAGFREGILGFLRGDVILEIGAPLAAGLSLPEFTGVLAHEFGHFTQRLAMRLGYVIRRINHWFTRVVHERDAWDEKLIALAKANDGWISIIFQLARLMVGITRKILWVLMFIGHAISYAMSRQMEYDADRAQCRVVGSQTGAEELLKGAVMMVAHQAAFDRLGETWQDRKLADDFPALTVQTYEEMPEELRQEIREGFLSCGTRWFDTHPSTAARLARIQREDAPGVFRGTGPASQLFSDFSALCRETSFAFYRELVGPEIQRQNLIPLETVTRTREQDRRAHKALWSQNAYLLPCRPIKLDRNSRFFTAPAQECYARLKRSREVMMKSAPVIKKTYEHYSDALTNQRLAKLAGVTIRCGLKINPAKFEIEAATMEAASASLRRAEQAGAAVLQDIKKIEAVVAMRLESAIALLSDESVACKVNDAPRLRDRAETLIEVLDHMHALQPSIVSIRVNQPSVDLFTSPSFQESDSPAERLERANTVDGHQAVLRQVTDLLKEVEYPYEHADGQISLARFVSLDLPEVGANKAEIVLARSEALTERLDELYMRIMAELALTVEKVESALGLAEPSEQPQTAEPGDVEGAIPLAD